MSQDRVRWRYLEIICRAEICNSATYTFSVSTFYALGDAKVKIGRNFKSLCHPVSFGTQLSKAEASHVDEYACVEERFLVPEMTLLVIL